jgi:predicted MFS family arabinose efflux permease
MLRDPNANGSPPPSHSRAPAEPLSPAANAGAPDNIQELAFKRRRLMAMFTALTVLLIAGQLQRSAGATLTPVLAADVGLGPEALAQVISAMFLAMGLSQIPIGVLLDRFGPRVTIPCMASLAALGCILFALADGFYGLALSRMCIGVGLSATVMGSYLLVIRWAPREKFSTYSGIILFIGGLGGIFATTPLTLLFNAVGWRATFAGLGVLILCGAVLSFLIVRDAPPESVRKGDAPDLWTVFLQLRAVAAFRHLWPLMAVGLILYTPQQILLGLWAGPFLEDIFALDAVARSHVLLAMSCGISIGMLLIGSIERLFGSRKVLVISSMLALAAMFFLLGAVGGRSLTAVVILLCAISLVSPFFIVVTAHAQTLQGGEFAGRVLSILNMTSILGVFLTQNITGGVAALFPSATGTAGAGAYQAIFFLMTAMFLGGALIYRGIRA